MVLEQQQQQRQWWRVFVVTVIASVVLGFVLSNTARRPWSPESFVIDRFSPRGVQFLNPDEFKREALASGYLMNTTLANARARRCASVREVHEAYVSSCVPISTPSVASRLIWAAAIADARLSACGSKGAHISRVIPWRFAILREGTENGFPHTILRTVCIPTDALTTHLTDQQSVFSLGKTLLHEKLHVYSRMFPDDVATCVRAMGFVPTGPRTTRCAPETRVLLRDNPDLDENLYILSGESDDKSIGMSMVFRSAIPKSLSDCDVCEVYPSHHTATTLSHAFEHPWELLAYCGADAAWAKARDEVDVVLSSMRAIVERWLR